MPAERKDGSKHRKRQSGQAQASLDPAAPARQHFAPLERAGGLKGQLRRPLQQTRPGMWVSITAGHRPSLGILWFIQSNRPQHLLRWQRLPVPQHPGEPAPPGQQQDAQTVFPDQEDETSYLVAAATLNSRALHRWARRSAQVSLTRGTTGKKMHSHGAYLHTWEGTRGDKPKDTYAGALLPKPSIAVFSWWENPNPLQASEQQQGFCSSPSARQSLPPGVPPAAGRTPGTTTPP